jgi:hypothetical protein
LIFQIGITSLKTINPSLDLGDGVSVADFITKIDETRRSLDQLDSTITLLNQLSWSLRDKELEMADLSQRLWNWASPQNMARKAMSTTC